MKDNHSYNAKELFNRIAQGDERAYNDLFNQYFHKLYAITFQYSKRTADAEDIVQSVFLKVWEKRHQLSAIENPENWLFITARNEFLSRFRKLRSEEIYRRYLVEIFEEEQDSPEHMMMVRQSQALLKQAVDSLPEKQKQAFTLSRFEGLTYEEIAVKMGIARTTVKEHIERALKSIRAFLLAHKDLLLAIVGLMHGFSS